MTLNPGDYLEILIDGKWGELGRFKHYSSGGLIVAEILTISRLRAILDLAVTVRMDGSRDIEAGFPVNLIRIQGL